MSRFPAPPLFVLVPAEGGANAGGSDVGVTLTVFIDYALPKREPSRLLGRIFGHWYARWCTARMVADAQAAFPATTAFGSPGGNPPTSR